MRNSNNSKPSLPPPGEIDRERCRRDPARFIARCSIQVEKGDWVPFDLWPEQARVVRESLPHRQLIWLKARQLGMTWLALALALHEVVFRPGVTVLLFSLRDEEAMELLIRFKGMHSRLPDHLKAREAEDAARDRKDSGHEWVLPNGSRAKAFPANRGDSYTAVMAVVDEADLVPDLQLLLGSVKPTIDAGGRLLLLSRSNKKEPGSTFKAIYRAAKLGENGYRPIFLPWHARPGRTQEWYQAEAKNVLANTGSLDDLHEHYPATDDEALAPRSLDKRVPYAWLKQCYQERGTLTKLPPGVPAIPGLEIYAIPTPGRLYVIGADPAEGNPTSDDSALTVLDAETGEEMAALSGRIQPSAFAEYADQIGTWFGFTAIMVERNNHGHAVLLWLEANSQLPLLRGHDARAGWLSSQKGKALLYSACADAFCHKEVVLHSFATLTQLQSIEGSTLRAPEGERDDRADSYALAVIGSRYALVALQGEDEGRTMMSA